jgi:hypothetical protein
MVEGHARRLNQTFEAADQLGGRGLMLFENPGRQGVIFAAGRAGRRVTPCYEIGSPEGRCDFEAFIAGKPRGFPL